ncbi:MAG: hypothetical protein V4689_05435 [Verrucomicrobiota bacterium]
MKTLSSNLLLGDKPMKFGLWSAFALIRALWSCGVVALPGHLLIGKPSRSNRLERRFA